MRIVVYNPLTLRSPYRANDISEAMPTADIVLLAGTQIREDCTDVGSVRKERLENHVALHWGYGRGRHTNKSTGVSVLLRSNWLGFDDIASISVAPAALRGRAGTVRLVTRVLDVTIMPCYFSTAA